MEEFNIAGLKINQFGYVYKDIEKQAKLMEDNLGLPKFVFLDNPNLPVKYRGKDTKVHIKIGFSKFGDLQVELIQLIEGECIYKEFLESGNEGLQHFGINVENLDPFIAKMQKRGFEMVHSGQISSAVYAYFDTKDIFGIILEFIETKKKPRKRRNK